MHRTMQAPQEPQKFTKIEKANCPKIIVLQEFRAILLQARKVRRILAL